MPLSTETIVLGDERDRLDRRLDELADRVADGDDDAAQTGTRVEQRIAGVCWAIEQYGRDAEVTVGALTTGEMAEVRDKAAGAQAEAKAFGRDGSADGAASIYFVAGGIVDGPFVNGEASLDALVPVVSNDLHPQFTDWLEHRIDDVTSVTPGNVTPFAERVAAKTSAQTSTSSSPKQS